MESSYLFTSDEMLADRYIRLVHEFSDLEILPYQDIKSGLLALREKPASIIFISDEISKEQSQQLIFSIRQDPILEYISVLLLVESWDKEKVNKWLFKPVIDGWIDLQAPNAIKQTQLKSGIQKTYTMKRLQKLTLDNQFIQNELSYYDRKRKYEEQKANRTIKEETKELIHIVRTYLTVLKDGVQILINESASDDQIETATSLIYKNLNKLEEYMRDHENVLQDGNERVNSSIKIIPIQSLMNALEKKLQYEANKKNISLFVEPKESSHSVLLKAEDLEFMIMDLFQSSLNLVKEGSLVYLTAYPLLSANTIEIKWVTDVRNIDPADFNNMIQDQFQTIQWLDDKESKFEKIMNREHIGFRFTLLRLT